MVFLLTLLLSADVGLLVWAHTVTVTTTLGSINGNRVKFGKYSANEYLGIPFAKPPVGERRFKKPEPIDGFYQINATSMPLACPQYPTVPSSVIRDKSVLSENCLFLNIWTPTSRCKNKAVMFWIHGGGFAVGGNRQEIYNGKVLAAVNNVIVVTINFRLNSLGYLYSGTDDAPGNVALYDMLLALKWVKENIAAFKGDPDNITVFGQSSGSITTGLLAVSPLFEGMYNRAIMESGAPTYLGGNNATKNARLSQELAKAVNCADESTTIFNSPKKVVNCLRQIDAYDLAKATALLRPDTVRIFQPHFGDAILPNEPRLEVARGNFYGTDLLIGDTSEEGSSTLIRGRPQVFGLHGEKNTLFNKSYAREILQDHLAPLGNPDPVIDYYLDPVPDDDYHAIRRETIAAISDVIYVCPDVFFAQSEAEKEKNVYFYYLVHRPSTSDYAEWMGVTHYSEVQFVFGRPILHPQNYTEEEPALSTFVMKKWTRFAKTGMPGSHWPRYSKNCTLAFNIGLPSEKSCTTTPVGARCDVLRPYFGF